ncbi:hypothetical protein HCA78_17230 [Listeria booriae]|uniref:LXG domain-containing protein n=1 Tax=Listeria booriae TaxID=1552123 RepID=A0A842CZR4_9LIST|nr:T7SS effector LXG polymorphic toxin [Listeria booriae]MBC2005514.1 hypothetical protein [Listeria booriae]
MKIDVRELRELVNEHITALTKEHETLNDAMTATTTFTTETQEFFKGKTADASRAYLQEAYLPVQQKTLEVNELMTKTLDAYIADAEAQFGANGIVDIPAIEMEYRRNLNQLTDQERQEYQELNNLIQEANEFISFPTINLSLLEELQHDALAEINKIHMKLEDFDTKWNAEFNKVETLQTELDRMLTQVNNNKITPTSYQAGTIKFMNGDQQTLYDKLPPEFKDAITSGFATIEDFQATDDGFIICTVPIGTDAYADWYTYSITDDKGNTVFGLCKMRSDESHGGLGISVSFVQLDKSELSLIFSKQKTGNDFDADTESSIYEALYKSDAELNPTLVNYFYNPTSKASYLIADLYVNKIIETKVVDNKLSYPKMGSTFETDFTPYQVSVLESLGVYQNGEIIIADKNNLSENEYRALLMTFSGNPSIYSFAAEVQTHAWGVATAGNYKNWTQYMEEHEVSNFPVPEPLKGLVSKAVDSVYASGIKSDSGVGESGENPVLNFAMDKAFGEEDSYFTNIQREIHKKEVENAHGW